MPDPRRKIKRYQTRWKAALVFDSSTNKPVFHTLTSDLSLEGTCVHNQADEPINSVFTLLLVPPAVVDASQTIIRLKAVVMSSTPFRNGFRLGLCFIHDRELVRLRTCLEGLDLSGESLPSEPDRPASVDTMAARGSPLRVAGEVVVAPMGVLNVLKQKTFSMKLAEEKLAKEKLERQRLLYGRISDTLMSAYRYFTELIEQLNYLKPRYPKTYSLANVAVFSDLTWQDTARTNCITRRLESEDKVFNKVTLDYSLANPREIEVVREYHIHKSTKQVLEDSGIPYRMTFSKNDRGRIDRAEFFIPCEVKAGLTFTCNDDAGTLLLTTRNVEDFGIIRYGFPIERLDQTLLDQLTLMILGEKHGVGKLIRFAMPVAR